jgi:hypothetical protein
LDAILSIIIINKFAKFPIFVSLTICLFFFSLPRDCPLAGSGRLSALYVGPPRDPSRKLSTAVLYNSSILSKNINQKNLHYDSQKSNV